MFVEAKALQYSAQITRQRPKARNIGAKTRNNNKNGLYYISIGSQEK